METNINPLQSPQPSIDPLVSGGDTHPAFVPPPPGHVIEPFAAPAVEPMVNEVSAPTPITAVNIAEQPALPSAVPTIAPQPSAAVPDFSPNLDSVSPSPQYEPAQPLTNPVATPVAVTQPSALLPDLPDNQTVALGSLPKTPDVESTGAVFSEIPQAPAAPPTQLIIPSTSKSSAVVSEKKYRGKTAKLLLIVGVFVAVGLLTGALLVLKKIR